MVAKPTIHIHFVCGGGKCGAGSGVCIEESGDADVKILEESCDEDDHQ
jgi:hypothetical protein